MIVRERLTGQKPPKGAQRIVDLWRPLVEAARGRAISTSSPTRSRTSAPSANRSPRALALDMGEDIGSTPTRTTERSDDAAGWRRR